MKALKRFWELFRDAAVGWWNDNVPRLGASLSYYTLFAIAPILVVAIGVAGLVFGADAVRHQVVLQLDALIGKIGAQAVETMLQGAGRQKASIIATVVGSITSMLTASAAFLELQTSLNTIWRVKPDPHANIVSFILNRVRAFGLVLAIGFLLLVSLAVSAALAALSGWFGQQQLGTAAFWEIANVVISVVVISALFSLLFKFLPDVHLRWRDVASGSIVTAVLFTVGKELIGLYLGQGSVASSYGAAASVVILLLWVYYASLILLFGAEFVRARTIRALGGPPPARLAKHAKHRGSKRGR